MRVSVLVALPAFLLAGCVNVASPVPDPVPLAEEMPTDACGAADLQGMVGQSSSVLQTMKFAVPLRVIESDMAVTMDYLPNRLNFWLDPGKKIARVTCG